MEGPMEVLVSISSATQSRGPWKSSQQYLQPVDRSHSEMVKYGPDDEYYRLVKEQLDNIDDMAVRIIRARFHCQQSDAQHTSIPHSNRHVGWPPYYF
jgi:hypothetical protein